MDVFTPIVVTILTTLVGAGAAWLWQQRRYAPLSSRALGLEERLRLREEQLLETREQLAAKESGLDSIQQRYTAAVGELREYQARLEEQQQAFSKRLEEMSQSEARLKDVFRSLSAETLAANNQSFIDLAKSVLGNFNQQASADLDKKNQNMSSLVGPLQDSLAKVDQKLGALEKERVAAYEGLKQQVVGLLETQHHLRQETSNLVKALRAPSARGRWGEIQLKRVVEMAGMVERCDFIQQASGEDSEGFIRRPDLVVNLPGGKQVVVDAKTPLSAYLEALDATTEEQRGERLTAHAAQVRKHISQLSQKAYWEQFETAPEFVVLFLPGEVFFSAALEQDPGLIEAGVNQRVILATPTTLIALLRAVAYGWRSESMTENARQISNLAKLLYKRLSDTSQHMQDLGKGISRSVECYNKTIRSLESRVLVSARKLRDLDVDDSGREIKELTTIEHLAIEPQAPELRSEQSDTSM